MIAFLWMTPMWPIKGFGMVKMVSMSGFSGISCDLMNEEHCDYIPMRTS